MSKSNIYAGLTLGDITGLGGAALGSGIMGTALNILSKIDLESSSAKNLVKCPFCGVKHPNVGGVCPSCCAPLDSELVDKVSKPCAAITSNEVIICGGILNNEIGRYLL